MSLIRCDRCHTPIAAGHIERGAIHILCKRCGHKTWVMPAAQIATASGVPGLEHKELK